MWPFKQKLDDFGRSELHYAAADADLARAERLVRRGADVDIADKNGWTPLHFAAQSQSPKIVALILDGGARIDPQDAHGNTPLSKAVFECKGIGDTIELLRARGADPHLVNRHGQTPVGLARLIGNFNVAQFFTDLPPSKPNQSPQPTAVNRRG
jgi:ankyrin repeat protein